jgi:hypothetical protein
MKRLIKTRSSESLNGDAGQLWGSQWPEQGHHHITDSVYTRRPLESYPLSNVVNDTRSRAYCGPTAVAAIVAQPVSVVRDAFRFARYGGNWVNRDRAPAIIGTANREVEAVLQIFGFVGRWQAVPGNPTLAAFLEKREGEVRTHPCIIGVTRHWVTVSGWQFCDTISRGMVVDADEAPRRRKRVKKVFVITGHTEPARYIPRKCYHAAKTKVERRGAGRV